MTAYYNEIDKFAAQWLRNLIDAGHIAPGHVDERSIEDVTPHDLHGYTQCHFFAGVGVWSLALRRAGWSDSRSVWTASCPCQPFSAAGQGAGFADERHLWPALYHLIDQCRPATIYGEQVASKDSGPWIDLVHADMEAVGYAFGCVPFPSAGVGAPHIRDRAYWVANANDTGLEGRGSVRQRADQCATGAHGVVVGMADNLMQQRPDGQRGISVKYDESRRVEGSAAPTRLRGDSGMADATRGQHEPSGTQSNIRAMAGSHGTLQAERSNPGPTNGLWADADWLYCRDGKWRPVEPGTFPLAHGAASRVGRLRAYGNAINAQAAQIFIEACMT